MNPWIRTLEVEDPTKPVVIALVWSDAASPIGTAAEHVLRNDLDLYAADDWSQWNGNDFDPSSMFTIVRSGMPPAFDLKNNVERVTINAANPPPNFTGVFRVVVMAKPLVANAMTHASTPHWQDFALAVINAHLVQ
jgi:hypothetical protein